MAGLKWDRQAEVAVREPHRWPKASPLKPPEVLHLLGADGTQAAGPKIPRHKMRTVFIYQEDDRLWGSACQRVHRCAELQELTSTYSRCRTDKSKRQIGSRHFLPITH